MKQLLSISLSHQHLVQYNFWLYIFTCLFNLHADYIMTAVRNINNLRYADDTTLMAESKEELKCFLTNVKEESEKVGLKFNIQKN